MDTTPLSKIPTFVKLKEALPKSGFRESVSCLQGFVLGMLAQGFTAQSPELLKNTIQMLNDEDPLAGAEIALFTKLCIESEQLLKEHKLQIYVLTAQDNEQRIARKEFNVQRLSSIRDFAYGLSLGINFTPSGIRQDKDLNEEEKDDLRTLEAISEIDVNSKLDEENFMVITDFLYNMLYQRMERNNKSCVVCCK